MNLNLPFEVEPKPEFFQHGACFNRPDLTPLFFPQDDSLPDYGPAQEYCRRCPVATQCRDYAIQHQIHHGLWGGLDPRQRERYRRNPKGWKLPVCEECGRSLTGRQRLFCSSTCVRKSHSRRKRQGMVVPSHCKQCGREFNPRNPHHVICGDEKCRSAHKRALDARRQRTHRERKTA